jgi:hypothetical protein
MTLRFVVRAGLSVVLLFGSARAAGAQSAAAPVTAARDRAPFTKNVVGVEIGGALLSEAWNFNGNYEWIGDGSFAMWWAFKQGHALVVEFHAFGVHQARPRAAFVNGIMPIYRVRLFEGEKTSMFVELGAGVSWSDTDVPPRGTKFNYLIVTSAGLTHKLNDQIYAIASARVLHLSNASLMGPNRNPDIEAVGGYFGMFVGF